MTTEKSIKLHMHLKPQDMQVLEELATRERRNRSQMARHLMLEMLYHSGYRTSTHPLTKSEEAFEESQAANKKRATERAQMRLANRTRAQDAPNRAEKFLGPIITKHIKAGGKIPPAKR